MSLKCQEKEKNKENEDPDDRDFVLPKKKKARFNTISTNSEIEEISKVYVPVNTKTYTSWSLKVFSEWQSARDGDEKCPSDLFENPTAGKLNYWLPWFIVHWMHYENMKGFPLVSINKFAKY